MKQHSINVWKVGRKWVVSIFRLVVLLALSYIVLYPLFAMISYSLRTPVELADPSVVWIPKNLDFSNYSIAVETMGYWKALWNTVFMMMTSAFIEVFTCSLAAYGFARFKFKGQNILFGIVLLMAVVPAQSFITPLYLNFRFFDFGGVLSLVNGIFGTNLSVNLIDTPWVFWIPSLFGVGIRAGLFIFIYRQFFMGLPRELEEAAYIDGAGPFKTFLRVILPSSGVVFLTVSIFSMIWHWNDYYLSVMYFTNNHPLAVALSAMRDSLPGLGYPENVSLGIVMAACVLFVLPMLLIYGVLQRKFIQSVDRVGIVG